MRERIPRTLLPHAPLAAGETRDFEVALPEK
jgi:hypothetical protein